MGYWIVAHNVISPLGVTSIENYTSLQKGKTAITGIDEKSVSSIARDSVPSFNFKKLIPGGYTFFEELLIRSVTDALSLSSIDPANSRVGFILSTTKGNIDEIGKVESRQRLLLPHAAKAVSNYFGNPNKPVVVSNACISGIMALIVANRLLEKKQYDHIIVMGADVISQFVLAGFQSLNAVSSIPCKPFDRDRTGISLGEAAATVIVSRDKHAGNITIKCAGGGLSNDANHISGPSKTGEELAMAISHALEESKIDASDVDFVSAHGTATVYNDEMESRAFYLAGLSEKPVNSLKGSLGHTLGAAGLVESVMNIQGLINNEVLPTTGFENPGVSRPLQISSQLRKVESHICLKTGSGFGGCNAAVIFQKELK